MSNRPRYTRVRQSEGTKHKINSRKGRREEGQSFAKETADSLAFELSRRHG